MENKLLAMFVAATVTSILCVNATWILVGIDLLWLLVKSHTLVSWWWPVGTGAYAVLALGALIWLKLLKVAHKKNPY